MVETDASLVEINPLVITTSGELIALDAKINFDDNAMYRRPEIEKLFEPNEEGIVTGKQIGRAHV